MSEETAGGDQWYDHPTTIVHTNVGTVPMAAYSWQGVYYEGGPADQVYVPVSVKY